MKTHLHLVSMPMHDPLQPSAQLGYLHAHIAKNNSGNIQVSSYSAHLDVFLNWKSEEMRHVYNEQRLFGEELFLLVCCYDDPILFDRIYRMYLNYKAPERHVTRTEIGLLCEAVKTFVNEKLIPSLSSNAINLIGFTTTFAQILASIYAARIIKSNTNLPVIFVFGGASVSLPETNQMISLWGIDGLLVKGSGEFPLGSLIKTIIKLEECSTNEALISLVNERISNVLRIGSNNQNINLDLDKNFMDSAPDPDYDEFFLKLREISSNENVFSRLKKIVPIPLEGSRGCFAKCDFCQNPNITSQFRTMKGEKIAERALRVSNRYGTNKLYFADSVCNTWAEAYADQLIKNQISLKAFMEMRVHASQSFFTKLSLAGVNEIQLGIEAISSSLLKSMAKGTKVWQNLRVAKFLAELGIQSLSNLITHHPKSTIEDVIETKRILSKLKHFRPFTLSQFVVSYASPIFNNLSSSEQNELTRGFSWLSDELRPLSPQRDLAYHYPSNWLKQGLKDEWDSFRCWYQNENSKNKNAQLTIQYEKSNNRITDSRGNEKLSYFLDGREAKILDICHDAPKIATIVEESGLNIKSVKKLIQSLRSKRLILELDDRILSLPLRPRSKLIQEYYLTNQLMKKGVSGWQTENINLSLKIN